jgi:hypothetical protein
MNKMNKIYAGVGSRSTPEPVLRVMQNLAKGLAVRGFVLRSGAAQGADQAFERGCDLVQGKKEIFLPWDGFEKHRVGGSNHLFMPGAEVVAAQYHPNYHTLTQGAQKLMARNSHQILGLSLGDPVAFVLFWAEERQGQVMGGTGQAVRIARAHNIPCFNLLHGYEPFIEWFKGGEASGS